MKIGKTPLIFLMLAVLLALSFAVALNVGPVHATPDILWNLRLPRVILGLVVGMALACAGVIFQGLLRNPLADPYILGTSSGASLGILLAGLFHWRGPCLLYLSALGFAWISVFAVHHIARVNGRTPVQTLILAGVLVSTFLNAIVFLGVSLYFRDSFSTLFFLLGTLTEGDPILLRISAALVIGSLAAAWALGPRLNALSQGDETAKSLGIHPETSRRLLFFVASILVSAAVAISGMIGFVGLMVPHMMRLLIGPNHRTLMPASALGGAILLILMDAAARSLAAPLEIPVGVLTAISGTPFLIFLLRRKKRRNVLSAVLQLESVEFSYGPRKVLSGISLGVQSDDFMGILGPNSSGKSTLLRLMSGLRRADSGVLRVMGRSIEDWPLQELARTLAVVGSEHYFVFPFSVEEIVLMGRLPHLSRWGVESEADRVVAAEAMHATDVWSLRDRPVQKLSSGERQRVLLARALAQESQILLLDEPTAHLDIGHEWSLMNLLLSLHREKKLTVVCALHDIALAHRFCSRVVMLQEGVIRAQGAPSEVLTHTLIQSVFGSHVPKDLFPSMKG